MEFQHIKDAHLYTGNTRKVYAATPQALRRGDRILLPFGSRGTQAAIVSHFSRNGRCYACVWMNKGGRWSQPRPVWHFLGHGHGRIVAGPQPPLKSSPSC